MEKIANQLSDFSGKFDIQTDKLVKNNYLVAIIAIILVLYASLIAPKLPPFIYKLFDFKVIQLLMLFLIALIAQKNGTIALISAICFVVTLIFLNNFKIKLELMTTSQAKLDNDELIYASNVTSGSPVADVDIDHIDLPLDEIANEVEIIKKNLDHEPTEEETKAICGDVIKAHKMKILGNGEGDGIMGVDMYANPQGEVYEPV